jgi:hypothetical protein
MSSTEFSTVRCGCCDMAGHSTRRCPELRPPPHGFDTGQRIPDEEGDDACYRNDINIKMKKKKKKEINIYITALKNPRPAKRARY